MFNKLVILEPVKLVKEAIEELKTYAKEIVTYDTIPSSDEEKITRIADADALLVSYTSTVGEAVLSKCPNLKYVGMCCSLYSKESANVDINYAEKHGIDVRGIRDYGDRGVVEFVISEIVRFMHGFDRPLFYDAPSELLNLKVGVVGLGVTGKLIADYLQMFDAKVSYYSRTRKSEYEAKGVDYMPLNDLLTYNDVIITCLNKNVILLHDEEFAKLGNHKILINISIGPSYDIDALTKWLQSPNNYYVCDTLQALQAENLLANDNVFCANKSAGMTLQAYDLLSQKVLTNIKNHLSNK